MSDSDGMITERTLLTMPFSVTITTVSRPTTGSQQHKQPRQIMGHGPPRNWRRNRPRLPDGLSHNVDPNALLKVGYRNNAFCLFYAIELIRVFHVGDKALNREFQRDKELQYWTVVEMMRRAQIPTDLPAYDAVKYLPMVQADYDRCYPGLFKLFVFTDRDGAKPAVKSEPRGDGEYDHAICIYAHDHTFDGIKNINTFFGKRLYCLTCESFFDSGKKHSMSCKARCENCGVIRHGRFPPCKRTRQVFCCEGCDKVFSNRECYDSHLRKSYAGNTFCSQSKRCPHCEVIYSVEVNTRGGRPGHVCGEDW